MDHRFDRLRDICIGCGVAKWAVEDGAAPATCDKPTEYRDYIIDGHIGLRWPKLLGSPTTFPEEHHHARS